MKTVLVVDDEIALASVIQEILEEAGYRVVTARNGREGLACLAQHRPDLVLSDVMMPVLDGQGLCRAMAAHPVYHSIPVVLFSAGQSSLLLDEDCPADAFIPKPFELDDLLALVHRLVGEPEQEDHASR